MANKNSARVAICVDGEFRFIAAVRQRAEERRKKELEKASDSSARKAVEERIEREVREQIKGKAYAFW